MTGPLSGLRVIEYAQGVNGPFCGKLLADSGATIIKVEPPEGDEARRWGPFPGDIPHPETSGMFLYLNTNKSGVTLNLETSAGRQMLWQLLRSADVLVENTAPGALAGLGFTPERLQREAPGLTVMAITPFGQAGPYRNYRACDLVHFHMGGLSETMASETPVKAFGDLVDMACGLTAALLVMGALFRRRLTGHGAYIDLSEHEAATQIMSRALTHHSFGHPRRPGPRGGFSNLTGVLPCKDGYVYLQAGVQPHFFPLLMRVIGKEEWAERPDLATQKARAAHANEIYEAIAAWTTGRTRMEAVKIWQNAGVPSAAMSTVADLMADPHVQARQVFTSYQHPMAGRITHPRLSPRLAGASPSIRPAPTIGQHNQEVYCGFLGYSQEDLVKLRATRAL